MRALQVKFVILFILSLNIFSYAQNNNSEITAEEIAEHVSYLASDEMKGRASGSEEIYKAAQYIIEEFKQYGLLPAFGDDYIQSFSFISGIKMEGENSLLFTYSGKSVSADLEDDFLPLPFSGNADTEGNLLFAGYGISAPKIDYDDYASVNAEGKIVVVLRGHPDYKSPHSKFDEYSSLRYKAGTARDKGAAGIIFVNAYQDDERDKLVDFVYDRAASIQHFPAVHVKRNLIEEVFQNAGLSLKELNNKINDSVKPASLELPDASVQLKTGVTEIKKESWNVAAILPGSDPALKDEFLVIGAHYDHLGMGETGSLYMGDEPMIHNGADDNASGTTGLLELAEKFSAEKKDIKRSLLFAGFSGEELGLLGSNYFVNNPPVDIKNMITMINMDMIGRLNDKKELVVYGTGTSTEWKNILNENNTFGLSLTFNDEGFGPSDHSSFYGKEIPVLFFFTGTHTDYHKPSDDADLINAAGEETVLKLVYAVSKTILNGEVKPDYLVVERKDTGRMTGSKVWVGTVPDFAGDVDGYKLSGVTEGSPAAKAGLQAGDIIIKFGDKKIGNIYDFTYAIGNYVPGDKVDVVVLRNGEEMSFNLELTARQ